MKRLKILCGIFAAVLLFGIVACDNNPMMPEKNMSDVTLHKSYDRPISDFIAAQGSRVGNIPPIADFVRWYSGNGTGQIIAASVDYAGLEAKWLEAQGMLVGTHIDGSIYEQVTADGRAEVTVNLITTNALTWAIDYIPARPDLFVSAPLIFGSRPEDVMGGVPASFADFKMRLVIIIPHPGASLPDLFALFNKEVPDVQFVSLDIKVDANGFVGSVAPTPVAVPFMVYTDAITISDNQAPALTGEIDTYYRPAYLGISHRGMGYRMWWDGVATYVNRIELISF